jgi:tetratricopeptide (TPR) repeat protein
MDVSRLQEAASMRPTLNLFEHLLSQGVRLQQSGQSADARRVLSRLAEFREMPPDICEEVQVRLALLALKRRHFTRARRHLTAALNMQPSSARYHFLMATACRADDTGDLERARHHFARSLELSPDQPRTLADSGLLLLRMGHMDEGLGQLRRAAELAPDEVAIVDKLAKGLCRLGRAEEARSVLRESLFRNPRCPRFARLWSNFQFLQARRNQEVKTLHENPVDQPTLLPFVRSQQDTKDSAPTRQDDAHSLSAPHRLRVVRHAEPRRVSEES